MDAIQKIKEALAALPANADSPWTNLDKMPYIHKTDDRNASPGNCAVVGRFDYLQTMDYMLACQPAAIREVLQLIADRDAEVERLRAWCYELREALAHLEHNARKSGADMGLALDVARATLTTQGEKS